MKYKAVKVGHLGLQRYLVVPDEMHEHRCFIGERQLSDDVICQATNEEWAKRIAELLNGAEA